MLRSIVLAMACCLASWAASAQPIQGFYVGGGAGGLLPFPAKNTPMFPGTGGDFDLKQHPGFDSELSVGYALGDGWRFELEGTYGRATVSGFEDTPFPAAGSGSVRHLGFMANALFDLDVRSPYVYPYLGVGAGYQSTRLDGFALTATSKPLTFAASGEAGGFAMQAIAGLSFPLPNMPGLSLTVDYRIMDILAGETFGGTTSFGPGSVAAAGATKFHNQFDQIVMFGVRYAFDTPRPEPSAPPPATAEPPPSTQIQTYLVSFEPDNSSLTNRAQGIVKQAAMASAGSQAARIEVTGDALGSGGNPSNHALSEQRARVVAAALVNAGVPRTDIAIRARGEMTGPSGGTGAVQPKNPRVEIVPE